MISCSLHHACTYPAATQKGEADLCFNYNVHVQMHVHTGVKIFSLHITNKVARAKINTLAFTNFTHQNFPSLDFAPNSSYIGRQHTYKSYKLHLSIDNKLLKIYINYKLSYYRHFFSVIIGEGNVR